MEINRLTGIVQSFSKVIHQRQEGHAIILKCEDESRWMVMIRCTNYRISPGDVVEVIDDELLWIPCQNHHDGQRFDTMGHLHPVISPGGQFQ